METSTASTDTATTTKLDEIRARHAQYVTDTWLDNSGGVSHQDRAYLLNLIKRIEEGIKFRWSDNEGEVTNGITELLNASR